MTQVIARVHSVHLENVEQRQEAADPQTKPPDLRCESACRLLSSTTTIAIYYYHLARKLILIYRPTEGRKLSCHSKRIVMKNTSALHIGHNNFLK